MRKKLFSIIVVLMAIASDACAQVTINETHFPDEKFRSWVSTYCDTDKDGKLSAEEIAAVTEINVTSKGIADLTGIGYFTALNKLACGDNKLTSLHLSMNTQLTELRCQYNELTSLDLSKNTKLQTLYCFENKITEAGMYKLVKSLPEVTDPDGSVIYIVNTKSSTEQNVTIARSLVVAANAKKWIVCDFQSDSKGTKIVEFKCSEEFVDINEENFPDAKFRKYVKGCDTNHDDKLSDMEIFATTWMRLEYEEINDLTGIEHFTALELLYCNDNNLTSLDFSQNIALESLYCDHNKLTSLDVSKNAVLTTLYCDNNKLTSLDVSHNSELNTFQCHSNQIKGAAMTALVNSLPTWSLETQAHFYPINTADPNEQNVITLSQVAVAKEKGWQVEDFNNKKIKDYEGSGIVLYDDADNSAVLAANNGYTNDVKIQDRTLEADKWNSLCLPFALTAEQIAASPLAGATIRTLDSYENDGSTVTVKFADVTEMEAGTPYIVKFTGSDIVNPIFGGVTISDATASVTKGDATFIGTYEPVTLTAGNTKALFLQNNMLNYPATVETVNAFRGYFTLTSGVPTSAEAKILVDFGDATAISEVKCKMENVEDAWYTVSGMRLNGDPTVKGLYIKNGKKVMVK